MKPEDRKTLFRAFTVLRTYAEGIFLTIFLALVIRSFVVTPYRVTNDLMSPSIVAGDFLMAYRLPYGIKIPWSSKKWGRKEPLRGDLVVFSCPSNSSEKCMRRVVGLPGDRIELRGERLFVNGIQADYEAMGARPKGFMLEESFLGEKHSIMISGDGRRKNYGPVIVGPSSLFVLSDYRDLGKDSREWGGVPIEEIEASVSFIWLSLSWGEEEGGGSSGWPKILWERVFTSPD